MYSFLFTLKFVNDIDSRITLNVRHGCHLQRSFFGTRSTELNQSSKQALENEQTCWTSSTKFVARKEIKFLNIFGNNNNSSSSGVVCEDSWIQNRDSLSELFGFVYGKSASKRATSKLWFFNHFLHSIRRRLVLHIWICTWPLFFASAIYMRPNVWLLLQVAKYINRTRNRTNIVKKLWIQIKDWMFHIKI